MNDAVALVTGSAQRVGADIVRHLHNEGFRVVVHYRHSSEAALALCQSLNEKRSDSAAIAAGDLASVAAVQQLADEAVQAFGRLDVLVNNASGFFPTAIGEIDESTWDSLLASNLKGPFFLCQALAGELRRRRGGIINIADVYAERPLASHPVYSIAKAGVVMMTKSLALELAPSVRVNAIAPGAILWPNSDAAFQQVEHDNIASRVPLQRIGDPGDIASLVVYLAAHAPYISGQVIAVDGGRSLSI